MTSAGPVSQAERINSLDTLRGFALLGILPANILIFGMYFAAGNDLTITGGPPSGWNLLTWALVHVLIEGKMRCLFSMVFGASAILLTARAEERSGAAAADVFYRRNFWLLLFGIAHGFLLFWGDILYQYALCALFLFPFRKLSARKLLMVGALFIAFEAGWSALNAYQAVERRNLAAVASAAVNAGRQPSQEQASALQALAAQRKQRKPTAQELEQDAAKWRGSPLEVIRTRANALAPWHDLPYYDPANCDAWSMMFLGMGLFKLRVFSAARTYRFYAWMAGLGYLLGLPLNSYITWLALRTDFDRVTHSFFQVGYDLERLPVALGHMALLMIVCKAGAFRWLTSRLAAAGQMALSNYILHSVICSFLFTGYGFGLYGRLERYQLYYVVAACWAVSLAASPLWLRHYRFGPLEWCWRSLTYWHRQPMRCSPPTAPPAAAAAVA